MGQYCRVRGSFTPRKGSPTTSVGVSAMRKWIKTYTSINRNPDMAQLTWAQRGILSALEALAGELDPSHTDGSEGGRLDTIERAAWRIRCESDLFEKAVDALKGANLVHEIEGILYVTRYAESQRRAPSDLPEATRERKRVQRDREKALADGHEDVTRDSRLSRDVTPSEDRTGQETQKTGGEIRSDQSEVVTYHDPFMQETRSVSADSPFSDSLTDSQRAEKELLKEACEIRIDYQGHPLGKEYNTMRGWAETYGAQRLLEVTIMARDSPQHIDNVGGWIRTVLRNRSRDSPEVAVGPGSRASH